MAARLPIDDKLLAQLQITGELRVEDMHGVPIILMTVDAREQLGKVVYDDGEWSADERMNLMAQQLNDPEGWGDVYDKECGHLFDNNNGKAQQRRQRR